VSISPLGSDDKLTSCDHSRFRWASCQLIELRKCLRPSVVRKTLAMLPATLDETYNRMLDAIAAQHREEAINALTWLVCSKRPLSVRELAEAVMINLNQDDDIDISERLFDANSITDILSGLILITGTKNVVRLAHFSVAEYLTSDRLAKCEMSDFWVSIPESNTKLLRACLRYMLTEAVQAECATQLSEDWFPWFPCFFYLTASPFIKHAAGCWIEYYLSCTGDPCMPTAEMVIRFLRSEPAMRLWKVAWGIQNEGLKKSKWLLRHREGYSTSDPVFFAALFGLETVFRTILAGDAPNPEERSHRTLAEALKIACYRGHAAIVHLLLDSPGDIEFTRSAEFPLSGDLDYAMNAAMDAAGEGRPNQDIIFPILNKITICRSYVTARLLKWSIMDGQKLIVAEILKRLDLNQDGDRWYRNAPHSPKSYNYRGSPHYDAIMGGDIEIVRLFSEGWEHVKEQDTEGRTALYWAVFNGNEEIVRLLLRHGADPNVTVRGYDWSPMNWAKEKGYDSIRKLLEQCQGEVETAGGVEEDTSV